jgi:transposase
MVNMTPDAFAAWLNAMNISAAEAARRLGVSPNTVTRYKKRGGDQTLALACAALYHRMEPWK